MWLFISSVPPLMPQRDPTLIAAPFSTVTVEGFPKRGFQPIRKQKLAKLFA